MQLRSFFKKKSSIDWAMLSAAFVLCLLGLLTMSSFSTQDQFFIRQAAWISMGVIVFFISASIDWRFLRRTSIAAIIYGALLVPLILLVIIGHATQGARSWFDIGPFALQPVEFVKIGLIIALAKYFSRRHIAIGNVRHIFVSGAYAAIVFILVAIQPDFGSALIIGFIWLGMVLISGIRRTHLAAVFIIGLVAISALWFFGFQEYQRTRILTFINPMQDIQGSGYNAYQSTVTVGSGQFFGKGIGYGTQSKLRFLPEYQTDFIFAAFAEEWGLVGVTFIFLLYGVIFVRIIILSGKGATNFETLFAFGVLFYFVAHFTLHVGINIGLLPVTGTTIPFMSYGGSHVLAEFLALGMLSGMNAYSRSTKRDALEKEFAGHYS